MRTQAKVEETEYWGKQLTIDGRQSLEKKIIKYCKGVSDWVE